MAPEKKMLLPPDIIGMTDIKRLIREVYDINDAFLQLKLRKSDRPIKLPKTSILLDLIVAENSLNLLQEADRAALDEFLKNIQAHSPVIHMSFSADPSHKFLMRLMVWLRSELHPQILLTVGLEPNIGAGCILRTTNKMFDMSLKQNFYNSRGLLISKMMPSAAPAQPQPTPTEAPAS
jgi:hypothetical protein